MTGTPGAGGDPDEQVTHPILAGYDGSASSRHALAYAAGMARRLDGHLIVVHVIQTQISALGGYSLHASRGRRRPAQGNRAWLALP